MNLVSYWQACRKLLTSSVVVGFPAWVMTLILPGSADMPATLKMWLNYETDVASNVHWILLSVRPVSLILARQSARLVLCS